MNWRLRITASLNATRFDVGSSHWVDVTHINQPDNFYIRPTAYSVHLPKLEEYLDEPFKPAELKPGGTVVYVSEKEKRAIRGQIRNMRAENGRQIFDLFALDYGFMESVSSFNLKRPLREGVPPLAVLCELADCQPMGLSFDKDAIESMVFFVGNERTKMIVRGRAPDKMKVQLINSCPEDIATMMALTGYSTFGYGNNVISRMPSIEQPRLYYTYKQVKVGDTMRVRVQSGTSLQSFFVCEPSDYATYIAGAGDFASYIKMEREIRGEDLEIGKPLVVHTGIKFERAIIKEVLIPRRRAMAQLVDWGKTVQIDVGDTEMRELQREYFFVRPAMAIYCSTDDKQAWDNGLQRFLYPGYEFVVTIKKLGNNHEAPHVVNITRK